MLLASDSVSHSLNFVFDRIRSVMPSADDNSAQLPADPVFLTLPSRVVMLTRSELGPGPLVSRDELRQLVEH